jgi:hypothetical protein
MIALQAVLLFPGDQTSLNPWRSLVFRCRVVDSHLPGYQWARGGCMHRSDPIPPPSPIEQRIDHALLSSVLLFPLVALMNRDGIVF